MIIDQRILYYIVQEWYESVMMSIFIGVQSGRGGKFEACEERMAKNNEKEI